MIKYICDSKQEKLNLKDKLMIKNESFVINFGNYQSEGKEHLGYYLENSQTNEIKDDFNDYLNFREESSILQIEGIKVNKYKQLTMF